MPLQENRPADDAEPRKAHYGSGKQPWDTIRELGWAPEFAAANVLKYLRRSKDPEHSIESARWYYARLKETLDRTNPLPAINRASEVYKALMNELTNAELKRLIDRTGLSDR